MAIATDPDQLIKVPLACPDGTPEDNRPHLLCRAMSRREHARYRDLLAEALKAPTDEDACAVYEKALNMTVRGFDNVTDPATGAAVAFSPDAWQDFTHLGLATLANMLPDALKLNALDFFRSPLRPRSTPATPAGATTEKAGASTPQATSTPTT